MIITSLLLLDSADFCSLLKQILAWCFLQRLLSWLGSDLGWDVNWNACGLDMIVLFCSLRTIQWSQSLVQQILLCRSWLRLILWYINGLNECIFKPLSIFQCCPQNILTFKIWCPLISKQGAFLPFDNETVLNWSEIYISRLFFYIGILFLYIY